MGATVIDRQVYLKSLEEVKTVSGEKEKKGGRAEGGGENLP